MFIFSLSTLLFLYVTICCLHCQNNYPNFWRLYNFSTFVKATPSLMYNQCLLKYSVSCVVARILDNVCLTQRELHFRLSISLHIPANDHVTPFFSFLLQHSLCDSFPQLQFVSRYKVNEFNSNNSATIFRLTILPRNCYPFRGLGSAFTHVYIVSWLPFWFLDRFFSCG
jgi:hypothetical protein